MDWPGIESEKENEKEMVKLMSNRSISEGIKKEQAGMNLAVASAADANYSSNSGIDKNPVTSDGLLINKFCEKGGFTSVLKMGLAVDEEICNEEKGLPSWIRTVNGGAKHGVVAEFTPSLALSSVGSSTNSINLFPHQSCFGCPIAVMRDFEHRTSSDDNNQDGCSEFLTSFRSAASTIPSKQSGAQLTIFYGGAVNVYDDIPADKAQAIMLIAGSGNYSSYPCTKVQNDSCGSETELKISLPLMHSWDRFWIHHQLAKDLPITRRHSLQRFLEKRKNRFSANAKSPYTAAEAEN